MRITVIHTAATLAAVLAAAAVGACGSDKPATTSGGAARASVAPSADTKRACQAMIAIDDTHIDHATGHDSGLLGLAKLWRVVSAGSTGAGATAAETIAGSIEKAVATGRTGSLEGGLPAPDRTAHRWAYQSCGLRPVDLTAREYAFGGAPARLEPGEVALSLRNVGSEPHGMALARIKDGVHETVREIVGHPASMFDKITLGPGGNAVPPAGTDYLTARLRPGRWMLVDPEAGTDGKPHFLRGQAVEIRVG